MWPEVVDLYCSCQQWSRGPSLTYDSELTDESREGDRLVSLPLLVLGVSAASVYQA